MIRRTAKAWLSLVLLTAAGCNTMHDCINDCETSMRNHVLSQKAWCQWSWCYDDLDHPYHFARGFKAGYEDILAGGSGCQPTLPPRCYWKPCYQSAVGRSKINSWFDGFSHGAVAAQQDGYGDLQSLPISPTARANFMSRNAPVSPACFDGMYHGEVPTADENFAQDGPLIPEAAPGEMEAEPTAAPPATGELPLPTPYEP
jgi:hypothetical protein